jgi:hypothetical protein
VHDGWFGEGGGGWSAARGLSVLFHQNHVFFSLIL